MGWIFMTLGFGQFPHFKAASGNFQANAVLFLPFPTIRPRR
jgi:hypothetical protein